MTLSAPLSLPADPANQPAAVLSLSDRPGPDSAAACLDRLLTAQSGFLRDGNLQTFLTAAAGLWRDIHSADLVYLVELAWCHHAGARLGLAHTALAEELGPSPVSLLQVQDRLSATRTILESGAPVCLRDGDLEHLLGLPGLPQWKGCAGLLMPLADAGQVQAAALVIWRAGHIPDAPVWFQERLEQTVLSVLQRHRQERPHEAEAPHSEHSTHHCRPHPVALPASCAAAPPPFSTSDPVPLTVSRTGISGQKPPPPGAFTPPSVNSCSHLVDMLTRLDKVRAEEHRLRQEAETLLQGLRILTGSSASPDMFRDLLALVSQAIQVDSACVVSRHWQGKLMSLASTDTRLDSLDWEARASLLVDLPDEPQILPPDHPLLRSLTQDNAPAWCSLLVAPLQMGHDRGWLLCLQDCSDSFLPQHLSLMNSLTLLARQALAHEEHRNQLLHAGKLAALGSMIAGILHEVNQPLNAIMLASHNLEAGLGKLSLPEPALNQSKAKITRIRDQVNRIHDITQKMRTFVRRTAGATECFSPIEHIENVVILSGAHLKDSAVELDYTDQRAATFVFGDSTQFEQVVANLVVNACDSITDRRSLSQQPAHHGRIEVSFQRTVESMLEITFRDTGTGFSEQALRRAFDPFFTTKEVGRGTGLGLSISASIMAHMGGGIRVENWANGAVVTLWLPVAD